MKSRSGPAQDQLKGSGARYDYYAMTRSYMVEWLIKNTGRFAEDLEEMSTEDIATEYEAEHAEAQQAEADRRYRSLKPKERIQAGIELARDVETVLGAAAKRRGVSTATFMRDIIAEAIGFESRIRGHRSRG